MKKIPADISRFLCGALKPSSEVLLLVKRNGTKRITVDYFAHGDSLTFARGFLEHKQKEKIGAKRSK